MDKKRQLLAGLPKVDEVLHDSRLEGFFDDTPRELILDAAREAIDERRQRILQSWEHMDVMDAAPFFDTIKQKIIQKQRHSLKRVVNATGVVLHTNLGRASLAKSTCQRLAEIGSGYSNLEYDVRKGARGLRNSHVEQMITKITGAEAAMAVNNNAAATLLCLSAMAQNREVIVSRGELVEIGGSFRVPDIMAQSGASLVEIGTTNKTRISDYENAITEDTAALMKVHTSNYRIVGFTAEASLSELVTLGKKRDLPVIYDMGSGLMVDLKRYGIDEPTVKESLRTGIDVILFSGDKLLGGPQAGIIAGKKTWIDAMKNHPLARIARIDKLTLAALEDTFRLYLDEERAVREIPVLAMLVMQPGEMKNRGERLAAQLADLSWCETKLIPVKEKAGGGSAPLAALDGFAVSVDAQFPAEKLERELRKGECPVIARIIKDRVCFDLRTISDADTEIIAAAMRRAGEALQGRKTE